MGAPDSWSPEAVPVIRGRNETTDDAVSDYLLVLPQGSTVAEVIENVSVWICVYVCSGHNRGQDRGFSCHEVDVGYCDNLIIKSFAFESVTNRHPACPVGSRACNGGEVMFVVSIVCFTCT